MNKESFRKEVVENIKKNIVLEEEREADGKKFFLNNIKRFEKEMLDGHFPEDFDMTDNLLSFIKDEFVKSKGADFQNGPYHEYSLDWVLKPTMIKKYSNIPHPNFILRLFGVKKNIAEEVEHYGSISLVGDMTKNKPKFRNYFYSFALYLYENFGIVIYYTLWSGNNIIDRTDRRVIDWELERSSADENTFCVKGTTRDVQYLMFSFEPPLEVE